MLLSYWLLFHEDLSHRIGFPQSLHLSNFPSYMLPLLLSSIPPRSLHSRSHFLTSPAWFTPPHCFPPSLPCKSSFSDITNDSYCQIQQIFSVHRLDLSEAIPILLKHAFFFSFGFHNTKLSQSSFCLSAWGLPVLFTDSFYPTRGPSCTGIKVRPSPLLSTPCSPTRESIPHLWFSLS